MIQGICIRCFQPVTPEDLYRDPDGNLWDICTDCYEKGKL
ncbi:hypothetical protein L3Y19_gp004 [Gordonia phage Neville]|uniref:Uncharacterized protein n=2 Tax=Nevillevirus TaxID=3044773 RepID=A0A515MGU2_9CAUD|nr:hypothetical protein L3Y19_gp004 [Gordonia phage Neville]YP_010245989.1 hypothetical protein L3Y20_gp004 [Gordonia phage Trax]AXQ64377.1 hypothetical protein SEA_NEVILLE_4 [Gordonia phage Neville]QDM55891.1 hypothetical protein SEA_TRAX_4 [Gordonia phage Trax]